MERVAYYREEKLSDIALEITTIFLVCMKHQLV
jgi:hypothetical protein